MKERRVLEQKYSKFPRLVAVSWRAGRRFWPVRNLPDVHAKFSQTTQLERVPSNRTRVEKSLQKTTEPTRTNAHTLREENMIWRAPAAAAGAEREFNSNNITRTQHTLARNRAAPLYFAPTQRRGVPFSTRNLLFFSRPFSPVVSARRERARVLVRLSDTCVCI